MADIGSDSSQQPLSNFITVARRSDWVLTRAQRHRVWEKLQANRAMGPMGLMRAPTQGRLKSWFSAAGRPLTFRMLTMATALGVLAVVATVVVQRASSRPWHHDVQLASESDDAVLALGDLQGPGDISFSDGTQVGVVSTAQIVVEAVAREGAEVRLVRGAVDVHVMPRAHAHWTFGAGPFRVEVKGTSFRLDWQPKQDRMTLNMFSGVVMVRGGNLSESLTVGAGESVVLTGAGGLLAARKPLNPQASDIPHTLQTADPAGAPDHTRAVGLLSPGGMRRHGIGKVERRGGRDLALIKDSWPALVARGAFAEIVTQARRRGIENVLAHGSDVDLAAFADAARYTREPQLARRGLLALRARFPGTDRAKSGAFFLGRLGEAGEDHVDNALAWYDRYLQESPGGSYAEGAMAREMFLLRQHKMRARATAMAERYLAEYPEGTYRELAIRLIGVEAR